jgi:hypothetical protein
LYSHESFVQEWEADKEIQLQVGDEDFIWTAAFTPDRTPTFYVRQDRTMRMWKLAENLADPKQ